MDKKIERILVEPFTGEFALLNGMDIVGSKDFNNVYDEDIEMVFADKGFMFDGEWDSEAEVYHYEWIKTGKCLGAGSVKEHIKKVIDMKGSNYVLSNYAVDKDKQIIVIRTIAIDGEFSFTDELIHFDELTALELKQLGVYREYY